MSDTSNRGRVLFVLMTNRPDKLDIDIKRAGRLDRKIPFLYPQTVEEVETIVVAQLRKRTSFGSPRVLAVAERRGDWLAVLAPELDNGAVGWIPANQAKLFRIPYSLEIDLSRRQLVARRDGKTITRTTVAIGKSSAATPRGTFAVTDRLLTRGESPYGCCVLPLTAHQPHVPQGWGGGNRIAIHSTPETWSIGQPVSHGCLRLSLAEGRWLLEHVPLGTPTFIRT